MRYIKAIILAILLPAFLFSGCVGDDNPPAPELVADFSPVFEQITGDPACRIEWESGDSLKTWYFDGAWVAVYPYSKRLGGDPTWLGLKIPRSQKIAADSCMVKDHGIWTGGSADNTGELKLKPRFAVLKITLDASGTSLSDKSFTAIKLKSDAVISGNAIVDIPSDTVLVAPAGDSILLQPDDSISFAERVSVYAVVWPTEISRLTVDISCTQGFHFSAEIAENVNLVEGACTDVALHIAELTADGSGAIEVERTDLSEKGTSNCYIVSKGGYYRFKATRGNSAVVPSGLKTVDWLWRDTAEALLDEIELDKDGNVLFHAGYGKGNTILAGFNEGGEIVWSWHIWLTEEPKTSYGVSEAYRLMDRNLGATLAEVDSLESYGFYYQWGRKDPFIGSSHKGYATATKRIENPGFTTATAAYWVNPAHNSHSFKMVANTTMPDGGEIEYLIMNPMLFVTGTTWFYSTDNLTANKSLWGWDGSKAYTKSSYDPCPPGWKIPANMGGVELSDLNFAIGSEAGLCGMVYTGANGSKTYFPPTGARDYSGGYVTYAGWVGRYWGALYREKSFDCWTLTLEGDPLNPKQAHVQSSTGVSVRCIKE